MRAWLPLLLTACLPPVDTGDSATDDVVDWPSGGRLTFEGGAPTPSRGLAVSPTHLLVDADVRVIRFDPIALDGQILGVGSTGQAQVLAAERGGGSDDVLVRIGSDLRVARFGAGGVTAQYDVDFPLGGTLVSGEVVGVWRDLDRVCWLGTPANPDNATRLPASCPDTVPVLWTGTATLVALGEGGLWRVAGSDAELLAERADRMGLDRTAGTVVFANLGERTVTAIDEQGAPAWQIDAGGRVQALAMLPGRGVAWAIEQNLGSLLVLADADGNELDAVVHDQPIQRLASSPDGSRLGVVRTFDLGSYAVP